MRLFCNGVRIVPITLSKFPFRGVVFAQSFAARLHRGHIAEGHIHNSVRLIDEKNGDYTNGYRGHFASCDRTDSVRLFFASGRAQNRSIRPRHQRLNELSFNDAMVARLTDQMHINQQILIIDGDFYSIPYFQFRQPLGLSHSNRNKARQLFPSINPCLTASYFHYGAYENAVAGK